MLSSPVSMSQLNLESPASSQREGTEHSQEQLDEALYEAAKSGDLAAAFVAVQKGADPNSKHDIRKETALHAATYGGHKEMVSFLLQIGSDINGQTRLGRTALHLAMLSPQTDTRMKLVSILLAHGADLNVRDMDGKTARDYALGDGQFDLVDQLSPQAAKPGPISAAAIVPALAQATASLHAIHKGSAESDLHGVVRSV